MKKLVFIVAFFVSQIGFGQYYTFQVFSNYDDIFAGGGQLVEPFHSFLTEHGSFNPYITGPGIVFDDDPGDYIFPMYVVSEQANALEYLLIDSDIIIKYVRHNGETPFVLDRLIFKYFIGMIPEFLGIQDGIVQTDNEPLNIIFEAFQVDNYEQTVPSSTSQNNLTYHNIKCNGCDIFHLVQEIINIEIVENAELVEYWELLNLDQPEELNGFTISPNPNNGNFQISLNSNEFLGPQLTIFDALGRKIHKEKLLQTNNTIHLNRITPGLYFAQLNFNEITSVKKFVVK